MVINPVSLVIGLFVFACLFLLVQRGGPALEVPPIIVKVATWLLVLVFVLWLLQELGVLGHVGTVRIG